MPAPVASAQGWPKAGIFSDRRLRPLSCPGVRVYAGTCIQSGINHRPASYWPECKGEREVGA